MLAPLFRRFPDLDQATGRRPGGRGLKLPPWTRHPRWTKPRWPGSSEELPLAQAQALRQYAARIGESLQYGLGLDPRRQGRSLGLPVHGPAD